MSNSISNSKNTKTKITVMFAAIASVLIAGMGMNPAANASIIGDRFPGLSIDDIGQSAECVGVNVGCDKGVGFGNVDIDKNVNRDDGNGDDNGNGNGNGEPQTCEECFNVLTEAQMSTLLDLLELTSEAELCLGIANGDITAQTLLFLLTNEVGLNEEDAFEILTCLDLEIP